VKSEKVAVKRENWNHVEWKTKTWNAKTPDCLLLCKTWKLKQWNENNNCEKWKQQPWNVKLSNCENSHNCENIWWEHENRSFCWSWHENWSFRWSRPISWGFGFPRNADRRSQISPLFLSIMFLWNRKVEWEVLCFEVLKEMLGQRKRCTCKATAQCCCLANKRGVVERGVWR